MGCCTASDNAGCAPLLGALRAIPAVVERGVALQFSRDRAAVAPEFPRDLRRLGQPGSGRLVLELKDNAVFV
jgi:hypothetical protein